MAHGRSGLDAAGLNFGILGPVMAWRAGRPLALGGTKQRILLASLLAEPNRVVPVGSLVEALWDGEPSDSAEATLQVYVSRLRKVLAEGSSSDEVVITTWGNGYQLDVGADCCDAEVFARLRSEAVVLARSGDPGRASRNYREALALWRGPALADVRGSRAMDEMAAAWDERRLATLEARIDVDLDGGLNGDLATELRALVSQHPMREGLWSRLMLALYRDGRQAEALEAYREVRTVLDEELALEPSPVLRELEGRILTQDPTLDIDPSRVTTGPPPEDLTERAPARTDLPPGWLQVDGAEAVAITHSPWTIGRHPNSDLMLTGTLVSRRHAQLVAVDGGFAVADLGSTNGTMVDGLPVASMALVEGSSISIGPHLIVFRSSAPEFETSDG